MRYMSILMVAGMFGTAPAMAQIWAPPSIARQGPAMSGPDIGSELGRVSHAIRDGRRSGQLSHAQARDLRRERDQIDALESRYSSGGMSDAEKAELDTRIRVLQSVANMERLRGRK